jgi:hypothetical protein
MICQFCNKPVIFNDRDYVKFAFVGKDDIFYHLEHYNSSLEAVKRQQENPNQQPLPLDPQIAV